MALKPWYKVATPREDLREGKPLDAAEFAVHLDHVRDKRAPGEYQDPRLFFERTYLTRSLAALTVEVLRRLSGERTETSAVFNLATQFGGGKTHALTLLYHLARHGPDAHAWPGVQRLLDQAGIAAVPKADPPAVFVGTEFDSITGRGGDDGTPRRFTPWGEIAFQLGGAQAFQQVAQHDAERVAPTGDVIRRFLPTDHPCLILMDELMNYISRNRASGLGDQFYYFLQNLSEEARARSNVVVAVSVPASEQEMTPADLADYERLTKMLDRLGKAMVMSAESEASEIIRRRLFEWDPKAIAADGRALLTRDAVETTRAYAAWIQAHESQIPTWFPSDRAERAFAATYPFHPLVFSVFERKWQTVPNFQRTRGVLRLLALWVSRAYAEGFKRAQGDPLIGLGTAPLDDPTFRAAAFEQLGQRLLEGPVTTDICGQPGSWAVRLDEEAPDTLRRARLHRKIATSIFFESNGGQGVERQAATLPEVRLDVAEPDLDIGNVETALDALADACCYLTSEHNRYFFSLKENLNKRFADRRAAVKPARVEETVRESIQTAFKAGAAGVDRVYFPERSNQIPDRPALTLAVLAPERSMQDRAATLALIHSITAEAGASARTFKSALLWAVADSDAALTDTARRLLAWQDIRDEPNLQLDDAQRHQLEENVKTARRDLREAVWRSYRYVALLGKDNTVRVIDFGLVHSSAAESLVGFILARLGQDDEVKESISPTFLVRNWPPAFIEWSTRNVRDAFFASPQFPRVLSTDVIKDAIARGVAAGVLAYVGRVGDGDYEPFHYKITLPIEEIEITNDMFVITRETADTYQSRQKAPPVGAISTRGGGAGTGEDPDTNGEGPPPLPPPTPPPPPPSAGITRATWTGEIPAQKWTTFYTRVLARFAAGQGLKLTLNVEVAPPDGISAQKIEETKVALRELGLPDDVRTR